MKIAAAITTRWRACWATTFTFEPAFFESFLLRRLGDPPLNVVVVADFSKLIELWGQVDPAEMNARAANRRYLLRGASIHGGAFHPKTILVANKNEGLLFVGSGNLRLSGVEQGHELFTRFDSTRKEDLSAFRTWRSWMSEVVAVVNDAALRARFAELLDRAPWLAAASEGPTNLITNWAVPFIDVFFTPRQRWSELHVSAPFFDADLGALAQLVTRSAAKRVVLYIGKHTSIDGRRVLDLLGASNTKWQAFTFEPPEFIHAKLVALIHDSRARVLSGSPNLSGPALLRAVTAGSANAEVAVVSEMAAEEARALFVPPDVTAVPLDEALLRTFRFARPPTDVAPAVRLTAAVQAPGGVVTIDAEPLVAGLALSDGATTVALRANRTIAAFPVVETAVLVWLCDANGTPVSNRVPLDDQVELERTLRGSATSDERPPDLDALDVQHPMGRLLAELQQTALFEIDTTVAARRVADLAAASPEDTAEFWDRLLKEQLAQDPRASRYVSRTATEPGLFGDELGHLLDQMLHQVPAQGRLRLLSGEELVRDELERAGHRWSPSQRLAVRAYNVLHRWALAVADPRIRWLSDSAPALHYVGLLGAILRIWQQHDWIPGHRLAKLAETLLGAFIRTERTSGYLETLNDSERAAVVTQLRFSAAPQAGAALAFVALRDATPDDFFAWQPFLKRALDWEIIAVGPETTNLIASMINEAPLPDAIRTRLEAVTDYEDDEHWCKRQRDELGLIELVLEDSGNPNYPLQVRLGQNIDLVTDARVVVLASEALDYAEVPGVRIRAGTDLLAVADGKPVYGTVKGVEVETSNSITFESLEDMIRKGIAFGAVVRTRAEAAS